MEKAQKTQLMRFANHVRQGVVEGTFCAKAGHPGGSLSIADTLSYLYNVEMCIDPQNPAWPQRDRLVLSKGHACPASVSYTHLMYGCDNFCSYCIVPYVRGRERSRRSADILAEFKSLIDQGYKEMCIRDRMKSPASRYFGDVGLSA